MKNYCVFCDYEEMSFYNKKTNNKLLFKFSKFQHWYCVLCKDPIEIGHTLIIYKRNEIHNRKDNIEKLPDDAWCELIKVIKCCKSKILSSQLRNEKDNPVETCYFFMLSETEPYHLHFHLIPIYIDLDELKNEYKDIYKRLLKDANELLTFDTNEDYLEKCKDVKKICQIPTNFGHWYLGLLEMKKNLIKYCKCDKENKEKLHKAAVALDISDKTCYFDKKT